MPATPSSHEVGGAGTPEIKGFPLVGNKKAGLKVEKIVANKENYQSGPAFPETLHIPAWYSYKNKYIYIPQQSSGIKLIEMHT